jgi:3-hydroxy-3-methylglutaryl CoA synthase
MNTDCGIDALNFSLPRLFLPISDLAKARGREVDKLRYGIGLESMSVSDDEIKLGYRN